MDKINSSDFLDSCVSEEKCSKSISINNNNTSLKSSGEITKTHSAPKKVYNKPTKDALSPPNGGWGWVVTFSSFFINIVIIGTHNCFGILYLDLVEEFNESLSKTAWVGSISFGCILIFAPLSGAMSNRFGCRKVTMVGIIIASISLFISSFGSSVSVLHITYGFGFGFGTSLSYMQGAVMVARYFSSRRALASGIALAGSTLGTLVMAPFYDGIRKCLGWRAAIRIISGCIALTLTCAATYRPLKTSKLTSTSVEERIQSSPAKKMVFELSLWKNKAFLVWAVGVGLCKLGYLVPWIHMVKLSTDVGLPRAFGSSLIQYMGVTATISRLIAGKVADSPCINRLYLSQFSAFMMGLVNMLQPRLNSYWGLLVYALSLGVLDGGIEILLPVMTLDLVGAEKLSLAWGCILAVISVSSMGPPMAGAIREYSGSYEGAFYLAGIPMILSAFTLVLIPLWAKNQPQLPANSILSIDPIQLEKMAESSTSSHKAYSSPEHLRQTENKGHKSMKSRLQKRVAQRKTFGQELTSTLSSINNSDPKSNDKLFHLPTP